MRSEEEVRKAIENLAWYAAIGRQELGTWQNLVGVVAALEWLLGEEDGNPVAGTLRDIEAARRKT